LSHAVSINLEHELALQLAPTVNLERGARGITVHNFRRAVHFSAERPECAEVLDDLGAGPRYLHAWLTTNGTAREAVGTAIVYYVLQRLDEIGALSRVLLHDGKVQALLHPNCGFSATQAAPDSRARYVLSRFACLQPQRSGASVYWQVSSPLGHARLAVFDPACMAGIAALIESHTLAQLASRCTLADVTITALVRMLLWCAAVAPLSADGALAEDHSPALRHWEPHDLLFHSRSRMGRHGAAFGGTFHLKGIEAELPAIPPALGATVMRLPRPDIERLARTDPSLSTVLEARRSERSFGTAALTCAQLGELLYRAARLKEVRRKDGLEVAFYPYPGGGARSELCIYAAVADGQELAAGLYRYEAEPHALTAIAALTEDVRYLLHDAQATLGAGAPPPVLLVIASRFRRVSWKYQSMAYAVTLKNVGALMQTLYLSAQAMGLAACALGGGNADVFARCVANDYYEETSVGEFALGTRPCN
jgi:oxazoline/thiazoline dehydrogenase